MADGMSSSDPQQLEQMNLSGVAGGVAENQLSNADVLASSTVGAPVLQPVSAVGAQQQSFGLFGMTQSMTIPSPTGCSAQMAAGAPDPQQLDQMMQQQQGMPTMTVAGNTVLGQSMMGTTCAGPSRMMMMIGMIQPQQNNIGPSQTSENSNQFEVVGNGRNVTKAVDLFADGAGVRNENVELADFNPRTEESSDANGDFGDDFSDFPKAPSQANSPTDTFGEFSAAFSSVSAAGPSATSLSATTTAVPTSLDLSGVAGGVAENHLSNADLLDSPTVRAPAQLPRGPSPTDYGGQIAAGADPQQQQHSFGVFGMPQSPTEPSPTDYGEQIAAGADPQQQPQQQQQHLDVDQEAAMQLATSGHNLCLLGGPGSGKTHLIKKLYKNLTEMGKKVAVAASTGIAAANLCSATIRATTVHSLTGILDGRFSKADLWRRVYRDDAFDVPRRRLKQIHTLIIDEASMLSLKIFEQIEVVCRVARGSEYLFGDLQLIIVLDPQQLPPVSNIGQNDNGAFCFESPLWNKIMTHKVVLRRHYRAREPRLQNLVRDAFNGRLSPESLYLYHSELGNDLAPELKTLATHIYSENFMCERENGAAMDELMSRAELFKSLDTGNLTKLDQYRHPKNLRLKIDCKVMVTQNVYGKGVCNGMTGVVTKFSRNPDEVSVLLSDGRHVTLQRVVTTLRDISGEQLGTREQIPLRLAFAVTAILKFV